MKKYIYLLFTFSTIFLNAQTSQKNEKDYIKEIESLKQEISYLKEILKLDKSIYFSQNDGVRIDIQSIEGSKKDKTINIYFTYKNITDDYRTFFQNEQSTAVFPDGTQIQEYEVKVSPTNSVRAENLKPNILYKGNFQFKNVETTQPILKLLVITLYTEKELAQKNFEFENLNINWH